MHLNIQTSISPQYTDVTATTAGDAFLGLLLASFSPNRGRTIPAMRYVARYDFYLNGPCYVFAGQIRPMS